MGDVQRVRRLNAKLKVINDSISEISSQRYALNYEMRTLSGDEFLNAFDGLAKMDSFIDFLRREKIRIENLIL